MKASTSRWVWSIHRDKMSEKEVPVPTHEEKSFLKALKPTVFIGIVLGLFPRNDLLKESQSRRTQILLLIYSGLLFIFLTINAILMIVNYFRKFNEAGKTFMEKFGEFTNIAYALSMAFLHGYHLLLSQRLPKIISNFRVIIRQMGEGSLGRNSSSYFRFCWAITLSCMIFGMLESTLYDMQSLMKEVDNKANVNGRSPPFSSSPGGGTSQSEISRYFDNNFSFSHWHAVIPSNSPVLIVIIVILIKIGTMGWVFMDTLVIILCQGLSLNLKCLKENIENEFVEDPEMESDLGRNNNQLELNTVTSHPTTKKGGFEIPTFGKVVPLSLGLKNEASTSWEITQKRFRLLAKLTLECQRYLAPLIMTCYACLGHVLIILFAWIAPDVSVSYSKSASYYVYYSCIYFSWRVGVVTYFAGKVYHSGSGILETMEDCANDSYCLIADRMERKLIGNPLGIRLVGTFLISRHFFISLLGFIFTTEIVFLQMANAIR